MIKGIHVQEYGSQRITLLQKAIPLVKSAFDSIFNDSTPEDFATKVGKCSYQYKWCD